MYIVQAMRLSETEEHNHRNDTYYVWQASICNYQYDTQNKQSTK